LGINQTFPCCGNLHKMLDTTSGLPDNCPVCHAPKEKFAEKDDAIKTPADASALADLEKKHVPLIKVNKSCSLLGGCVDVHALMGEIIHPMLPEHFITSVDFYLDDQFLSRVILTPEKMNPAAGHHLKVSSGRITVIPHCNLHGSWIAEADL